MALKQRIPLNVPGSVSTSPGVDVSPYRRFTCYVAGLVGTWQLEISGDQGSTWHAFGSPVTNTGYVDCDAQADEARVSVTAYTSGTPSGTLLGLYRSEGN